MKRPDHLPDFRDPPLNEVVLGVQFAPIQAYTSVCSWKIWNLYKERFPIVQEHPLLEPNFETFGGANVQGGPKFVVGAPPVGVRLWFLTEDSNHLIQFQPDRFISNWRREPNSRPYPHFEGLACAFKKDLESFTAHASAEFSYKIDINQVEIAYINIISVNNFSAIGEWLEYWKNGNFDIEAINTSFNQIIKDKNGKPFARLSHQIQSVFKTDRREKAFRLSLTFKGKPSGNSVEAAMEFLQRGRDSIVTRFDEMTTKEAQRKWGKIE